MCVFESNVNFASPKSETWLPNHINKTKKTQLEKVKHQFGGAQHKLALKE